MKTYYVDPSGVRFSPRIFEMLEGAVGKGVRVIVNPNAFLDTDSIEGRLVGVERVQIGDEIFDALHVRQNKVVYDYVPPDIDGIYLREKQQWRLL